MAPNHFVRSWVELFTETTADMTGEPAPTKATRKRKRPAEDEEKAPVEVTNAMIRKSAAGRNIITYAVKKVIEKHEKEGKCMTKDGHMTNAGLKTLGGGPLGKHTKLKDSANEAA